MPLMANSKSPKNDFAPAWLKIPDGDASKSGSRSGEQFEKRSMRREDYYNYNRYPPPSDYSYQHMPRQRSFDCYEDRRYSSHKFRHHSMDEDYGPPYGAYPPFYNGYEYDKYGNGFRSHPSLYRDGKYQHPNARQSHGNGAYPPFYDSYYDYYGYMGRQAPNKRFVGERDRHPSRGDRERHDSKEKPSQKHVNGEEEFPSLNGDTETSDKTKVQNASGVWEKPPRSKPLSNGNSNTPDGKNAEAKGSVTNMYKALVPQKGSFKKSPHGTIASSPSPLKGAKTNGGVDHSSGAATNATPSAPVEILSTQVKSKRLGDRKSNFLRQMKGADANCNDVKKLNAHQNGDEGSLCNGVNRLSVSPQEEALSSSLEAEQRLLKEMGWKETDEEEYVITEDDMKEFQNNLTKQLQGKKNGVTRILPKTWSPTHLPQYVTNDNKELNDTLSSTSDDDSDKE